MRLKRMMIVLVAAGALALGVAACGGDDDSAEAGEGAETTMTEEAEAQAVSLTGEETMLVLDPDTAAVLTENDVTVEPIDPAAPSGDGIAFPITGGEVDVDSLAGVIDHSGGLRFSAGGTEVELTDFVVDTADETLTATAGEAELPTLSLDLRELERSMDGDVIVASGIDASLTGEAADALNDAFGVELFEQGLPIGEVTVRAAA
ncbi:MAG TPA: hypothetical protein VK919_14645 [Solirubrobacterales bacterium]|nr:hypothetical protein [Solirubrobacterales bacterium]